MLERDTHKTSKELGHVHFQMITKEPLTPYDPNDDLLFDRNVI